MASARSRFKGDKPPRQPGRHVPGIIHAWRNPPAARMRPLIVSPGPRVPHPSLLPNAPRSRNWRNAHIRWKRWTGRCGGPCRCHCETRCALPTCVTSAWSSWQTRPPGPRACAWLKARSWHARAPLASPPVQSGSRWWRRPPGGRRLPPQACRSRRRQPRICGPRPVGFRTQNCAPCSSPWRRRPTNELPGKAEAPSCHDAPWYTAEWKPRSPAGRRRPLA